MIGGVVVTHTPVLVVVVVVVVVYLLVPWHICPARLPGEGGNILSAGGGIVTLKWGA
jgi:hypothetical protein